MKNPVRYVNHSNTPLRYSNTPLRRHSNVAVSHHGNHLALTNVAGLLAHNWTPCSPQALRAHPRYSVLIPCHRRYSVLIPGTK